MSAGETARFAPLGELVLKASQGTTLGVMLLMGTPLREPIIQVSSQR